MHKLEITIRRGATAKIPIRIESGLVTYVPITSISKGAPVLVEATAHGLVEGWRAAVTGAVGMTELNSTNNPPENIDLRPVSLVDQDNIKFINLSSAGYRRAHVAGTGYLAYYKPVDLSQYAGARMECKDRVGGNRLALFATAGALTDPLDGELEIDNVSKILWLSLTSSVTTIFEFSKCVFDIELIRTNGDVDAICTADSVLTVLPEVTTTE